MMMQSNGIARFLLRMAFAFFIVVGCSHKPVVQPIFKVKDDQSTGLHFINKLTPNQQFNVLKYMYYYNGAGVGAGDFNNDGKTDLFFASNQGENKLYLNCLLYTSPS